MARREQQRRLDRMLADARREPPPPIDVDGMSGRLVAEFRRTAPGGAAAPVRSRSAGWRWAPIWAAGALALTLLALWLRASFEPAPAPQLAELGRTGSAAPLWFDARDVAVGQLLAAQSGELTVDHAAHARWTLSPGSEARLESKSDGVVRVVLASGSLSAEVSPSALAESFVVRARGTEVSVHGTRFEVRIEDEGRVAVSVSEGEVQVRPEGAAQGVLLASGMSGRFLAGAPVASSEPALDTAPHAVESEPTGEARRPSEAPVPSSSKRTPSGAPSAQSPVASADPAAESREETEDEPVAEAARETALANVTERIQRCFARNTERPGQLTIEASTRLVVEVEPSGAILEVRMNPPLAPAVEQCAARELEGLNLGESARGFKIDREIRLSR